MFNIVLFEPEIPPNTGNIIRLASNTGCKLHLIKPLGFTLEEKSLRRAGLDYHEYSSLSVYDSWEIFLEASVRQNSEQGQEGKIYALSTKGKMNYDKLTYQHNDYLLFGPETRGLPEHVLNSSMLDAVVRIPMQANSRSLNLSNSAAIVVYEAWRQNNFNTL